MSSNNMPALPSVFSTPQALEEAQRSVKALVASDLVPPMYRDGAKGVANSLIALDISRQIGVSILTVMQNLQIVEGVPSWKSAYLIERFAQNGIEPEYEFQDRGKKKLQYEVWVGPKGNRSKEMKTVDLEDRACRFVSRRGDKVTTGPWVSLEMAIREGWYYRNGSKWPTMTEKMLMYAAAREFNRFYPVVPLNNIPTEDELAEWEPTYTNGIDALNNIMVPPTPDDVIEDAEVTGPDSTGDEDEDMI